MIKTYETLTLEVKKDILLVKLNRPQKRNAINDTLAKELNEAFSNITSDIKCAVLYGEGKHFSAGLDLSSLKETNSMEGVFNSRNFHAALEKIQRGAVPVIVKLHGACVGGGLEIASACHIRVAEESTFYALPEGQRGIFVGGGASVRVPKLIGLGRTTDMILTGRVYKAEEGLRIGISEYVVPTGEGLNKAMELAEKVASNAFMTNYCITNILPRIVESGQDIGLMIESLASSIAQDSPEAKRRLNDFLEGRAKKVGQ